MGNDPYGNIKMTQVSQAQARVTATGLMTAKLIEVMTGNQEPMFESINQLIHGDPDLMAGCILTIVNLFAAYLSDNFTNLSNLEKVCDHLIKVITDDDPDMAAKLG